MPMVSANGAELYVEERGTVGDPMVLVHGSWTDHGTFVRLVPLLEQSFHLVTYDRRAHGRSSRGPGPYDIREDARDLAALLESIDLHPVHVVGGSLGGCVALRLAVDRPELIRSVVVHEPPLIGILDPADPAVEEFREAADEVAARIAAGDLRGAAREFIERVAMGPGDWARTPAAVQESLVAHALSWRDEYLAPGSYEFDLASLAGFDPPVMVSTGAAGRPLYREIADRLAAALPNVRQRVLPKVGHLPQVSHPVEYAGALVSFCLERVVPSD